MHVNWSFTRHSTRNGHRVSGGCGPGAGKGLQTFDDLLIVIQILVFSFVVGIAIQANVEGQNILGFEPEIDSDELAKAAGEKGGITHEHDCQCDLRCDQCSSEPGRDS